VAVPMYPGAPAPSARPTTVSVSAYLLYASAALSLVGSLLSLTTIGTTSDVYKEAYAGTAAEGTEAIVLIASVGGLVVNILFAAGLAILAIFNNRGRQGARVTTWSLGGVVLCCSGIGLAGTAATSALESSSQTGGPSAREVQEQLDAALPSWYGATTTTLSVLMLLALLASLILLALPASNAYFQAIKAMRQGGGWDPSMPYPMYPGQPLPGQPAPGQQAYPSYPGQPYPGQPGQPGQGYAGQPGQPGQGYPGQPYPGQPVPGQQPYPGQPAGPPAGYGQPGAGEPHTPVPGSSAPGWPAPGSPAPGSSAPGSPAPGLPAPGSPAPGSPAGGDPSASGQFGSPPPHTGSMPPTDPWERQSGDDGQPKPPTDPTAHP